MKYLLYLLSPLFCWFSPLTVSAQTAWNTDVAIIGDHLWIGTTTGLLRMDTTDGDLQRFGVEDGLVSPRVTALAGDSSGVLWIGTTAGVSRFDGSAWKRFTRADGLDSESVSDIAVDRNGAVWITTAEGVFRFEENIWTRVPGAPDSLGQIAPGSDGVMWFGSAYTVYRFDGERWSGFELGNDGDDYATITALACGGDGVAWAGLSGLFGGLYRWNGSTWEPDAGGISLGRVETIAAGPDSLVWVYGDGRLLRIAGDERGFHDSPSYRRCPRSVSDGWGRLWLMSESEVTRFENGVWTVFPVNLIPGIAETGYSPGSPLLLSNAPNPFNHATVLRFSLPERCAVLLEVFSATGQKVRSVARGEFTAGTHAVRWDGRNDRGGTVASGVYFSRLRAGERTTSGKMLFLR